MEIFNIAVLELNMALWECILDQFYIWLLPINYDYYILELYCSPILSESDRLDYSFPPVLGFDVFWAPASRRQQNDQLGEDPELLSLALKGFLILIWRNK